MRISIDWLNNEGRILRSTTVGGILVVSGLASWHR